MGEAARVSDPDLGRDLAHGEGAPDAVPTVPEQQPSPVEPRIPQVFLRGTADVGLKCEPA